MQSHLKPKSAQRIVFFALLQSRVACLGFKGLGFKVSGLGLGFRV